MKRHFKDISWASVFEWIMVVAFILVLTCSCTCEQRMARLQRRCPECFQTDTLHLRDTVPLPSRSYSGRLPIPERLPTLPGEPSVVQTLHTPSHTLTIRWEADTLQAEVEAAPDTVYLDRTIPLPLQPCPPRRRRLPGWVPWALVAALATGYHIGRRVKGGV